MEQKVKVRIKRDGSGKVEFELEGFHGNQCECIEELENSMGLVENREDTEDRYLYEIPNPALNELG